jgi:hypothetical protein
MAAIIPGLEIACHIHRRRESADLACWPVSATPAFTGGTLTGMIKLCLSIT